LFVDLNSYFASVEQQVNPDLRGKPVAVVPVMTDRTSCIAASYEAKKFGVKTGTNVGLAKRMCPGLILVNSGTGRYVEFHHRILAAAETVLPIHSVNSIDEFSCRLIGKQRERGEAEKLALAVKRAIARDVGECLLCSIGIAPNRLLAKLASDWVKPDGLTIIEKHELPSRLYELDVQAFAGIGPRMVQRLAAKGVGTVEELCSRSAVEMEAIWESVVGRWWYEALRGEDLYERPVIKRSISHQHVLSPERRSPAGSREVAVRLLTKAVARARALGYWARHLSVSVRHFGDRNAEGRRSSQTWAEAISFPECHDTITLVEMLSGLWEEYPKWLRGVQGVTPLRVGVALDDLVAHASATPSLFDEAQERERLSSAMDKVNARFGKNAVYLGSMHAAKDSAPSRIAFSSIPDKTWEEVEGEEDGLV